MPRMEILNLKASERGQESLDKDSQSTVDRATAIITKLLARVELCCPKCKEILENGS